MCGLAGIFSYDTNAPDIDALLRMREAMQARGPDGAGLWSDAQNGVALAHRRLAIIDLTERAAQPMASTDGRLRIVFNGEIYNHPELRAWCEARDARYTSDSDTETLLHLYALEGRGFVKRLRGMFAFALWDSRERTVLLARDPFGIKPLYYTSGHGQFRFASQVKALLAGGADTEVGAAGLVSFLTWGYVTDPHTWYRSIHAVPAGSTLLLRADGRISTERFHDPLQRLRGDTPPTRDVPSLHDATIDSVRHHLLADVPVGLFLSAGIDSATLCGIAGECIDQTTLHAVTLGFDEFKNSAVDEIPLSRVVAGHYRCRHSVVTYCRDDFEAERAQLLAAMDQPTVDGINTYFVSKAAASVGLKVALSGVGGDELFGGYPSFRQVPRLAHALRPVPRRLGRGVRAILAPLMARSASPKYAGLLEYGGTVGGAFLLRRALFMPWEIAGIVGDETARNGLEALDLVNSLDGIVHDIASPFEQVMALEQAIYLKNCLLRDADWAGMAHSLEIRTPLVDTTLFDNIVAMRRSGGRAPGKLDFAGTPTCPLPPEIQGRPKSGFSVPLHNWLMTRGGTNARPLRAWALQIRDSLGR